jgi:alginate O-acetyltransferase complex protein AlgJ
MSSTENKMILEGKNGWLFLSNDTNRVIDQITGHFVLPIDFDERWRNLFQLRRERMETQRCTYAYLVAPNKECVYAEHLPDSITLVPERPVHRVLQQANDLIQVHYPLELLKLQKEATECFPKGDTHWNIWGAFPSYVQIMKGFGIDPMEIEELEFYTGKVGDLSSKIGIPTEYCKGRPKGSSSKCIYDNGVINVGHMRIYENEKKGLPSCVMFRDSFGTILLDILAQSFSRFVVVWQPNIDYSIVIRENPDFVLSEQAERFLVICPNDEGGKTNTQYVEEKRTLENNRRTGLQHHPEPSPACLRG